VIRPKLQIPRFARNDKDCAPDALSGEKQTGLERNILPSARSPQLVGAPMFPICPVLVSPPRHWTRQEDLIREAIEFHLEGLRQHGYVIPVPSATTEYITV
jgi:hypothetical protein